MHLVCLSSSVILMLSPLSLMHFFLLLPLVVLAYTSHLKFVFSNSWLRPFNRFFNVANTLFPPSYIQFQLLLWRISNWRWDMLYNNKTMKYAKAKNDHLQIYYFIYIYKYQEVLQIHLAIREESPDSIAVVRRTLTVDNRCEVSIFP